MISLGVLILVDNLGTLDRDVWEVALQLWPLLLVAWGLELLLGRRSAWGAAIALLLTLAILVSGLVLLDDAQLPAAKMIKVDLPLEANREAQIQLDPAFAYLKIMTGDRESQTLLQGRIEPMRGERIEQSSSQGERSLEATLRTQSVIMLPYLTLSTNQPSWAITLHPQPTYDLQVDVGAGKTDLFVSDLSLDLLEVDTGIGQSIVHLPEKGVYQADISGGLGHIVVYLPDDLGVRLYADVGIGAIDVPGSFRREGDAYLSPNYQQADQMIEVSVTLGIGSIEIR